MSLRGIRVGCCALVSSVAMVMGRPLEAAEYLTFDRVDYVTTKDAASLAAFRAIWDAADPAKTATPSTARLAMFGDSQETSPGGGGAVYVPRLNFEFYQHFGTVGETTVARGNGSYSDAWQFRGSAGSTAGSFASGFVNSEMLPSTTAKRYTSAAYGQLTHFDPYNIGVPAGANIAGINTWDNTKTLNATVFARTFTGSDPELLWVSKPTDGGSNFFADASGFGTVGLFSDPASSSGATAPLNASDGRIVSATINSISWSVGGDLKDHQQLVIKGNGGGSDGQGADFLGVRFSSPELAGGAVVQSFSAGGYQTTSLAKNHADAGPMLKAFGGVEGWDAIIIHTGANDAFSGNGVSAEQMAKNMQGLIDMMRGPGWLNNPDQKFILITDPYRQYLGGEAGPAHYQKQLAQFDQYAGALASLALNDENIMAVNSRRLLDELGWGASHSEFAKRFLAQGDVVHYSDLGGRVMAKADAMLMLGMDPAAALAYIRQSEGIPVVPLPTSLAGGAALLVGVLVRRRYFTS